MKYLKKFNENLFIDVTGKTQNFFENPKYKRENLNQKEMDF